MRKEENQSLGEAGEIPWKRLAVVVGCAGILFALLVVLSCTPIGLTYRWLLVGACMLFAFAFFAVFGLYLARRVAREAVTATEKQMLELMTKMSDLEVELAAVKSGVDLFGHETKGHVAVVSERLVQVRQAVNDIKDRRS